MQIVHEQKGKIMEPDKKDTAAAEAAAKAEEAQGATVTANEDKGKVNELPTVVVKADAFNIVPDAGETIGGVLAKTGRFFQNGDATLELVTHQGAPTLRSVTNKRLAYLIDKLTRPVAIKQKKDGEGKMVPTQCGVGFAGRVMDSDEYRDQLPSIEIVTPTSVLMEHAGKLVSVADGQSVRDVFAYGKAPKLPETIEQAKALINELIKDFRFVSKGDRSRAIAGFITPAFVQGGLLGNARAPIALCSADQSQAGKGWMNKLISAVYCFKPAIVNFGQKGIGSAERSFDSSVARGNRAVVFDNVRGRISSQKLETFCTEDSYLATIPHSPDVTVDPKRTFIMMTSNEANLNKDLTNRTIVTRILKQAKRYDFASYPEGNILDHVRANNSEYHGAVYFLIQAWYDQGCPVDENAVHEHDFSKWAGILNYILTEILGEADMFAGYADVKMMLHTPNQRWLLEVARAMLSDKESTEALQTRELLDELELTGHETLIPGFREADTLELSNVARKCTTLTGRRFSALFGELNEITIENVRIKRTIEKKPHFTTDSEGKLVDKGERDTPCYAFEIIED
jgi:hypothetical protein